MQQEMSDNFRKAMTYILDVEGSKFVNHPKDRGGATKYGITFKTLCRYRRREDLDPFDVENLSLFEAKMIYKHLYWDRLRLDDIVLVEKAIMIFDQAVHSGVKVAGKMSQRSANDCDVEILLKEDGLIGDLSIAAINSTGKHRFCLNFFKSIQIRYVSIVKKKPEQIVFLMGWINRSHTLFEATL